ncbi:MAG: 50S ribosomal protein L4 [Candidatus Aminicenantes bacterium]|nr:50S ribosomal protein L4 [Candidatus Aminicenantes bacterium]
MAKIQILDKSGKAATEMNLPKEVFSYPVKEHLLYEAVISHRVNKRAGTASTKTRAEIRGGGRKPWRQKGTGRARAGSIRSPLWKKGGVTFGPKPRSFYYHLPKQAKKNALKSALAMKYDAKQLLVLNKLEFKEPKTKEGFRLIQDLNLDSALIVDNDENKNLFLSLRNIPRIKTVDYNKISTYDILKHKWLVFTEPAFKSLMEKLK